MGSARGGGVKGGRGREEEGCCPRRHVLAAIGRDNVEERGGCDGRSIIAGVQVITSTCP